MDRRMFLSTLGLGTLGMNANAHQFSDAIARWSDMANDVVEEPLRTFYSSKGGLHEVLRKKGDMVTHVDGQAIDPALLQRTKLHIEDAYLDNFDDINAARIEEAKIIASHNERAEHGIGTIRPMQARALEVIAKDFSKPVTLTRNGRTFTIDYEPIAGFKFKFGDQPVVETGADGIARFEPTGLDDVYPLIGQAPDARMHNVKINSFRSRFMDSATFVPHADDRVNIYIGSRDENDENYFDPFIMNQVHPINGLLQVDRFDVDTSNPLFNTIQIDPGNANAKTLATIQATNALYNESIGHEMLKMVGAGSLNGQLALRGERDHYGIVHSINDVATAADLRYRDGRIVFGTMRYASNGPSNATVEHEVGHGTGGKHPTIFETPLGKPVATTMASSAPNFVMSDGETFVFGDDRRLEELYKRPAVFQINYALQTLEDVELDTAVRGWDMY